MTTIIDNAFYYSPQFDNFLDDLASDSICGDLTLSYCESRENVNCKRKDIESSSTNSDFDSADSSDRSALTTFKSKKKTRLVHIPKILRSDIRRSYTCMLVNSMNSQDCPTLFGLLDTFFTADFQQQSLKFNPYTKQTSNKCLTDKNSIAKLWYSSMQLAPDAIIELGDTNVYHALNTNKSKIVSSFKFSATQVYREPDLQNIISNSSSSSSSSGNSDSNNSTVNSNHNHITNSNGNDNRDKADDEDTANNTDSVANCVTESLAAKRDAIKDIIRSTDDITRSLEVLPAPQRVEVRGSVTMYTDENMYIGKMVLEFGGVVLLSSD